MGMNLTRIYTKLGDSGETHLGDRSRVRKDDPRIEAYGTVDELGAQIGVALTQPWMPQRYGRVAAADPERPLRRRCGPGAHQDDERERLRVPASQVEAAGGALLNAGSTTDAPAAPPLLPQPRARTRRRPHCTSAGPFAGAPEAARRCARGGSVPGGPALPEPVERPAVHPRPRRRAR